MSHEKGVSLYLAVVMLSIILAVAFGLVAILMGQIKMMRVIGFSVTAYYAAETGVERALYDYIQSGTIPFTSPVPYPDQVLPNNSSYTVSVVCCHPSIDGCLWNSSDTSCTDSGIDHDENCKATDYCARSVGTYRGVKRAIEVSLFPYD